VPESCLSDVVSIDGQCCKSGVVNISGACCPSNSVLDRSGMCCPRGQVNYLEMETPISSHQKDDVLVKLSSLCHKPLLKVA
jgi:hypothetical protein